MIGALLAVLLVSPPADKAEVSPVRYPADRQVFSPEECIGGQIVCPFHASGRICVCSSPVINLGEWDPRESPAEWSRSNYGMPASFGTYPTEQKSAKTEVIYFTP